MIYSKVLDKIQLLLGREVILSVQRVNDKVYNIFVEDRHGYRLEHITIGANEAQLINTLNAIYRLLAFKAKPISDAPLNRNGIRDERLDDEIEAGHDYE